MLAAGDQAVAAARKPEAAPPLQRLKERHGAALHLVSLDIDDRASIKVRGYPAAKTCRT